MVRNVKEKRAYPRIKTRLKFNLAKNIAGSFIDLSEGGGSFSSAETISGPAISLSVRFPDRKVELKTEARLVWKRDLDDGSSVYGVEFVNLKEIQKAALREKLIKTQISGLLKDIKRPEVKKYISRFFLKDLLDYISGMVSLIGQLSKENKYSRELEKKLEHLNNKILLKGYCLELLLADKAIIKRVKDNFRQLVGAWIYKSAIVKWAFDKPRGYPGDHKMLDLIYDNKPVSKNIGVYFDNNFLRSPYAVAIRMRSSYIQKSLEKFINQAETSCLHILSIACGSCREIAEALPNLDAKKSVVFTCCDWDEDALKFSQNRFSGDIPKNVQFEFINKDIRDTAKNNTCVQVYGKQDLIYSVGLMDYLSDGMLKEVLQALYNLLREGGKLILTHKNKDKTFSPIPPDWFCDWKLISRGKDEILKLFYDCGLSKFLLPVKSDDFSDVYCFTIAKRYSKG